MVLQFYLRSENRDSTPFIYVFLARTRVFTREGVFYSEKLYFCKKLIMTGNLSIYDEVANFMAAMNPEKVLAFKPSQVNQERLDSLLDKKKESGLTQEETSEVEHYLIINRIVGLAKARAMGMLKA